MARKKSFSSELAHIYDSAILLSQEIKNYQETASVLITDAEKYRDIKPLLNDLARVGISADKLADKLPDDTPTILPSDVPLTETSTESPADPPAEAHKRARHIKKTVEENPA